MASSRRVLTKDDLFQFRWLQGAKLSPDGSKIAYVVSHVQTAQDSKGEDKEYTTLYLLDVASGESRQMTSGNHTELSPAWSPDGKTIAFVSDRVEKNQIFLLPVDGGEAQQLTDLKQGASNPTWSPDRKTIAFTAGTDWGEDGPPDRSKQPYRVTRSVWRFDAMGDLDLVVSNVYTIEIASRAVKQLTDTPTVDGSLKWSPDGSRILFAALMRPDSFRAMSPTLHVVDRDGNVSDLPTDWGDLSAGFWLPDSQRITFVGKPDDGTPIGTHPDLWVYNLETGRFDNRTPNLELSIGGRLEARMPIKPVEMLFIGIHDGNAYVNVQAAGTVSIYRIALEGDADVQPIIAGERACFLLDMGQGKLVYSVDDINATPDVYIANLDGSDERRLTHINDEFMADIILPEYQNLHFQGVDGAAVEGWYVKPTNGATAPYPTILWIHGGPHGAQGNRFAVDTQVLAGAGYGVLFVNHRASTGYGNAFSTAIKGDWGNLDYHDLMAGVDYAIELGLADADRLGCCGISGGGNLSCWIVGHTNRFKAAVPQNPLTNWLSFYGVSDIGVWFGVEELGGHPHEVPDLYRKCSPITDAHTCTTPTLMIQCEHDWRCPAEQSEQFYTTLRANGCIVEMIRHPGTSHGGSIFGPLPLRKSHLASTQDWFDRYVLGVEE